jgi:hypothetical protein
MNAPHLTVIQGGKQDGHTGWALAWLLGVPLTVLLIVYLVNSLT